MNWIRDARCEIPDMGYPILDVRYEMYDRRGTVHRALTIYTLFAMFIKRPG